MAEAIPPKGVHPVAVARPAGGSRRADADGATLLVKIIPNATKLARDLTTVLAVKDTAHEAKPGTSAGNQASR